MSKIKTAAEREIASSNRPDVTASDVAPAIAAVLDRNNTNFPLQLERFFHELDWAPQYDFLKYYQNIARIYAAVDTKAKGLLVYHTMGMGKSILAISIAVDMMDQRQPIILLTKSLQDNMKGAIRKYVAMRSQRDPAFLEKIVAFYKAHLAQMRMEPDDLPADAATVESAAVEFWIEKKFSFVSLNASNMMTQLREKTRPAGPAKSRRKSAAAKTGVAMKSQTKSLDEVSSEEVSPEEVSLEEAAVETSIRNILNFPTLENKLLIVDEAQNLFRMITNGSKNGIELYELILKTRNLKCMFFSGTPISSNPFELAICFNMLAGRELFPTIYKDFVELFMEQNGKIKNKNYFQNRIMGLVSHVSDKTEFHLKPSMPSVKNHEINTTKVEFPEVLPTKLVYVNMHPEQYALYNIAREKELEEEARSYASSTLVALMKPKSAVSTSFRVQSRKLSNFYYKSAYLPESAPAESATRSFGAPIQQRVPPLDELPADAFDIPKINEAVKIINENVGKLGLLYSQFIGDGGLAPLIRRLQLDGWERFEVVTKSGGNERPPLDRFFDADDEINTALSPHVSGAAEKRRNLADIVDGHAAAPRRFAVITGEVPVEEREIIMQAMTARENRYGTKNNPHGIDLLLISSTGSLGLDLKNIRYVIIFEPFWLYTLIKQIEARAARNDSHKDLPPNERNVQTYILLAVPPGLKHIEAPPNADTAPPAPLLPQPAPLIGENLTTDVDIYNKSLLSYDSIRSFEDAIREVAIECTLTKATCRICAPTNQRLFTQDARADINEPDPCRPPERATNMKSLEHGEKKYYYRENRESIFGYDLFALDEQSGAYQRLPESSPEYQDVIKNLVPAQEEFF